MGAPKGNQFWKIRSKHGRDKIFATPEIMWDAACEYFDWCDNNPLQEDQVFAFQGVTTHDSIDKMRAYTLKGLCLFLGVSENYFKTFADQQKDEKDFIAVITRIKDVIYTQKFTGAAAGLLQTNIIAMELGLKAKSEITGLDDAPLIPDQKLTKDQIDKLIDKL